LRKWILIGAALAVLGLVVAAGLFVWIRKHESRNVRGSSTVEFVPTEPAAPRPNPELRKVPWPTYGYDAARTRFANGVDMRPPFRAVWRFRAQSLVEFPPAVAYRRLYFANNGGTFFAISARTGKRAWKFRSHRCVASSPAVTKGRVYMTFLNRPPCNTEKVLDGEVISFHAGTGRIDWRRRIGPSESSPLVADGVVYLGDWRGVVYALDAKTGATRWTFRTGGRIKDAPALSAGTLYIGSYDHHVYALAAKTGRLRWKAAAQQRLGNRGTFYSTPAVAYGRVYIGGTDGKVYSFGASSGKLRWSHGTGGYVYGSPAVWRKRVLVGSYSGWFTALDAATGDVKWRFKADGPISGSATVLRGLVYFATLKRRTYALNAATGRLVWSFPDGKYTPVVADARRLYLVGYARVYGLLPRNAAPLAADDVRDALHRAHALKGAHFSVLRSSAGARKVARKLHGAQVCNVAVQSRRQARVVALLRDACAG
jgi:outer membrane protein assembly factor BamB